MELDCLTGEITFPGLSTEQKAQQKLDLAAQEQFENEQASKAAAKQAALAKLTALGLTTSEIAALVGA
jgi:hypothetical protein